MKFRVWDNIKKEMLYDNFIVRPDGKAEPLEVPTFEISEKINELMNDDTASYELIDFSNFYGIENYIVMHSTGVCDKNGKIIFESDIIITPEGIYTVKLKQGGFVFGNTAKDFSMIEAMNRYIVSEKVEVIGNIYEKESKECTH